MSIGKIYLLGMPCSGKSTLGEQLAGHFDVEFIDLDEAICAKDGRSIPQIFEEEGERFFRQLESETLKELSETKTSFVMATGGGTPCFNDNIGFINKNGTSVFIDVPVEGLLERLNSNEQKERPLFAGLTRSELCDKLLGQTLERMPYYHQASIELYGNNVVLQDLIKWL